MPNSSLSKVKKLLKKDDEYFCEKCWNDFHAEMNLTDQEKIYISHKNSNSGDKFLTLKDVLIIKEHWPAKYSAYAKKNKLATLRDEFYRRVTPEEISSLNKKVFSGQN